MKVPALIETDRLILRPLIAEDEGPFVDFMTDERATRFLDFDEHQKTEEGAHELLEYIVASYRTDDPVFILAVLDKTAGAFVGSCGLSPLADGGGLEVYYSLLPRYWGWGYATEAVASLLYYAFQEMSVERVVADLRPDNTRAGRVPATLGMRDEGIVQREGSPAARRFSITRLEYAARTQA